MQAHEELDYTKKLDTGLWRKLLGYLRPYHGQLRQVIYYMLLCAACLLYGVFPSGMLEVFAAIANGIF